MERMVKDKREFVEEFIQILREIPEDATRQTGAYVLGYMAGVRDRHLSEERKTA